MNIKNLRRRKGLSQEALGEAVGVNSNTVSRWEIGERQPSYVNMLNIAKTLDVYPSELLPLEWQKPVADEIDMELFLSLYHQAKDNAAQMPWSIPEDNLLRVVGNIYKQRKSGQVVDSGKIVHALYQASGDKPQS